MVYISIHLLVVWIWPPELMCWNFNPPDRRKWGRKWKCLNKFALPGVMTFGYQTPGSSSVFKQVSHQRPGSCPLPQTEDASWVVLKHPCAYTEQLLLSLALHTTIHDAVAASDDGHQPTLIPRYDYTHILLVHSSGDPRQIQHQCKLCILDLFLQILIMGIWGNFDFTSICLWAWAGSGWYCSKDFPWKQVHGSFISPLRRV